MKALFISLVPFLTISSTQGQGQLLFGNLAFMGKPAALVTDWDGKKGLAGPGFMADLYWAPGVTSETTILSPLNQPAPFYEPYAWWQPGLFYDGLRNFPGWVTLITAQVRVWDLPDGSSWEECSRNGTSETARVGESSVFELFATNSPYMLTYFIPPFSLHQVWGSTLPAQIPMLTVVATDTNALFFSWPAYYGAWAYSLQQTPDLNATNWVTLTNQPMLFGTTNAIEYHLSTTSPTGTMFYRLVQ